jgi:acyl dehydratase
MKQETGKHYSPGIAEAIARYEENIGKVTHFGTAAELFGRRNEAANKDTIRHFANGTGDPNPLWRDEEHAGKTKYGGIIAPPMFVNAIALAMGGAPLPGFIHFIAGGQWEWMRIIHVNDTITVTDMPIDIVDKSRPDGVGPLQFLQTGQLTYRNQRDEVVAVCRRMTMSVEQSFIANKEGGGSNEGSLASAFKYSKEELEAISRGYEEEEIRGVNTRYWEDVNEGDIIKPVVKGPLTHGDMLAFIAGVGWMDEAHGIAREQFKKFGPVIYTDPETGISEWSFAAHFIDRIGRKMGMRGANNLGIQTCCWLGHLMTNWMGNDGFLKKLSVECRQIIYVGDTTWCRGTVVKKYTENGDHLVDCEIRAESREGQVVAPGRATVILPSRSKK